jgi:hypothetical protein
MQPLRNRKLALLLGLGVALAVTLTGPLHAQTPAFSINPGKLEVEVNAGAEKTVAFEVTAASTPVPERARIMLSQTDWSILEDGSLTFRQPGSSQEPSATSWITSSPGAFTLESAQTQIVRITIAVPDKTPAGVYRTGLFVQERPSAASPEPGMRVINVRVRYVFLLYVIVPPVSSHPELTNVEVDTTGGGARLICEMKNSGNRHARPLVFWTIKGDGASANDLRGKIEATVLLPGATMREPYSLQQLGLAPGRYQAAIFVDFQDGQPQQSMARDFEIPVAEPPSPNPPPGQPDHQ